MEVVLWRPHNPVEIDGLKVSYSDEASRSTQNIPPIIQKPCRFSEILRNGMFAGSSPVRKYKSDARSISVAANEAKHILNDNFQCQSLQSLSGNSFLRMVENGSDDINIRHESQFGGGKLRYLQQQEEFLTLNLGSHRVYSVNDDLLIPPPVDGIDAFNTSIDQKYIPDFKDMTINVGSTFLLISDIMRQLPQILSNKTIFSVDKILLSEEGTQTDGQDIIDGAMSLIMTDQAASIDRVIFQNASTQTIDQGHMEIIRSNVVMEESPLRQSSQIERRSISHQSVNAVQSSADMEAKESLEAQRTYDECRVAMEKSACVIGEQLHLKWRREKKSLKQVKIVDKSYQY